MPGKIFCVIDLKNIPIKSHELADAYSNWQVIAARVERQLDLQGGDTLQWHLTRDMNHKAESKPHFWAAVEWMRDQEEIAEIHGLSISDHQVEVTNVESYVDMIVRVLKERQEKTAKEAVADNA